MRTVTYRTYWSYLGSSQRKESLLDFVLDIFYLMESTGVIPPFVVLNQVLQTGGYNGGMGPGTTWRRFKIKEAEYEELVQALLNLDVEQARAAHPYVRFSKVILDPDLMQCTDYDDWRFRALDKYRQNADN
jgi:hypothetical protein